MSSLSHLAVSPEAHPAAQLALPLTLLAVGIGTLIDHGLEQLPSTIMAIGALLGGIATLLPSISTFLAQRQRRKHAEAEWRARRARG